MNAWAAPYIAIYDGWIMRYANGYTRRANSILPFYASNLPIEEKIKHVESFYNDRALPTYFKMTNAALPSRLDEMLAEQDYGVVGHTSVQTLTLGNTLVEPDVQPLTADMRTYPATLWLESFYEMNNIRAMYRPLVQQMLKDHLIQPALFVLLWEGRTPVAAAMCVMEQGYAGIFDVVVHAERRGKGYGRLLMRYVLWQAWRHGAHTAYLQVTFDNTVANRLYASLGFAEVYRYWYREKHLPIS